MSASDKVNILLVDDQPAKLLSYEVILRDLDENLIKAGSARDALEQLLKKDIAVILIDVVMPDLDGFELATMIRSHPRFQTTAIIFVSAVALTDLDRVKGYEYGAVDYVPVPVIPEILRAKVRVFVDLYRKTRQLTLLNAELERRVADRTAELARANADLERRVEERTRERELALAQVHEMQKLESLGQLTGGLAHDFNNLLMAILGNLDLVAKKLAEDSAAKRLVDSAIQSAERGATLTARMLAFARRQELKPETVDVCRLLKGLQEMLQRTLGPMIQIGMDFHPGVAPISVDPNQLELALINLALNARDAMPQGGRLTITARREAVTRSSQNLRPGDYVCLAVTDTGVGMDDATLKRAAEPFFTTKEVGKGTGLGLSMVYGLAAQSGGGARIFSQPRVGTTVELWLPVAERVPSEEQGPAGTLALEPDRRLSVLVVDDDADVLASTAAMLEDLGHTVLTAPSGAAALDIVRSGATLDLVITDHAMPGMTGVEVAEHIRQLRTNLPVILATGYADLPSDEDSRIPRLSKPYRQQELVPILALVTRPGRSPNVISINKAKRA
ncbi:MAG TPA: response regulator [Alphaproteobacteria bacterium]|nr:response regulator [Alphaproteobacteria bacterium]